ncbi:ABC transporter permease subunit [Thermanaerosceptrum fracticalcis]|uniref:ABC transporter permease subunit n=1 Tax=Thermanaerosceptrum fracticalcis TaxID=1712410 RepID=A0A7G6DYS3_THEFR|nr:ABC transporter permease subunit [Thermanaerosceptrum fracticalcis]QNB44977.1 ABC transporter permease subunit [Thermanaerosceptrum fracticalcis]
MIERGEALKNFWVRCTGQAEAKTSFPPKPLNKGEIILRTTVVLLIFLSIYAFFTFDYKNIQFSQALLSTLGNFQVMFLQAEARHFTLAESLYQVGITLALAFLTTLLGAVLALFLGLLAAQNLSHPWLAWSVKGFVAFIRAVPTIFWVLIFAVGAGLGSVAAVIGMSFHSLGYLIKAYAESFEELDKGVIEALQSTGASWWQVIWQAVIPSSVTYLLSWTFLRFEINFMNAVAMGAAAGAGGIGFELFMASGHYFDLREVGFITYLILAVALVLEMFTMKAKARLQVRN